MSESVSKHIVRQWSSYGIEVLSSGDDSCTLVLPPRVEDIGDLCEDLWDSFGATVDIEYDSGSLRAVVWYGRKEKRSSYAFYYIISFLLVLIYAIIARRDNLKEDAHSFLVWLLSCL